jgi:hypothetical protein
MPAINPKPRIRLKKADYGDALADLRTTPEFRIFLGKRDIGHITTGHALIHQDLQGKGHFFFRALPKYERFTQRLFARGMFGQYKEDVIAGIGVHANKAAFTRYIRTLENPTHLQFWRDLRVARKFMVYGKYTLAKPSIRELEKNGLPRGATQEQIAEFLKTFKRQRYPGNVLFLLEKTAQ